MARQPRNQRGISKLLIFGAILLGLLLMGFVITLTMTPASKKEAATSAKQVTVGADASEYKDASGTYSIRYPKEWKIEGGTRPEYWGDGLSIGDTVLVVPSGVNREQDGVKLPIGLSVSVLSTKGADILLRNAVSFYGTKGTKSGEVKYKQDGYAKQFVRVTTAGSSDAFSAATSGTKTVMFTYREKQMKDKASFDSKDQLKAYEGIISSLKFVGK